MPDRDGNGADGLSPGAPVAVIGGDETVEAAMLAAGGELAADPAAATAVVAVGGPAVRTLAHRGLDAPVLPVGAGPGFRSVPPGAAAAAVEALFEAGFRTLAHPVVAVEGPAGSRRAVADVALVVAEPGRISEFGVHADGRPVGRVRADGVVAALPAGSPGYARAAGGPVVAPGSDVLAVVPVAPYAVDPDHWVLPAAALSLTVERAETPVALVVDGEPAGRPEPGSPVDLAVVDALETAVVAASRPPRGDWKHLNG